MPVVGCWSVACTGAGCVAFCCVGMACVGIGCVGAIGWSGFWWVALLCGGHGIGCPEAVTGSYDLLIAGESPLSR
jgi:hypothetical protein